MRFLASLLLIVISCDVYSEAICKSCKVTGVQPDPRRGGTYIFVDGNWTESTNGCSGTMGMKAFFVAAGSSLENHIVSSALYALATGKSEGYVFGNGQCTQEKYEHINYMLVK